MTDKELMDCTLQLIRDNNVWGLTSGPVDILSKWKKAGGDRILPATWFDLQAGPTPDQLRDLVQKKQIMAFAELTQQYIGVSVNDPAMEPYYRLAEELDVPIGVHMGPGPPGVAYHTATSGYRMRLSSLLLLEDVLVRHPRLRIWAMRGVALAR